MRLPTTRILQENNSSLWEQDACHAPHARCELQATTSSGAVISNGLIKLGVTSFGALNVDNPLLTVVVAKGGAPVQMERLSISTLLLAAQASTPVLRSSPRLHLRRSRV